MAATVTFERSMFCLGQQRRGGLVMLGLARWLLPSGLEYGAIALFVGQAATVVPCAIHLWRGRSI
jgi:hypothetical protein